MQKLLVVAPLPACATSRPHAGVSTQADRCPSPRTRNPVGFPNKSGFPLDAISANHAWLSAAPKIFEPKPSGVVDTSVRQVSVVRPKDSSIPSNSAIRYFSCRDSCSCGRPFAALSRALRWLASGAPPRTGSPVRSRARKK